MVKYISNENLLKSAADALVNPVNCAGVMGKGLAKEFKKVFPECFPPYEQACKRRQLVPGKLMLVRTIVQPDLFRLKRPAIVLFPTKLHWKDKSKLIWIEEGLLQLRKSYREWQLVSIAMPQIGCGLGGLNWDDVMKLIEKVFREEELELLVYLHSNEKQQTQHTA